MTAPAERRLLAILLRLVNALALTVMFAMVKLAAERGVNLFESVVYRQLLAIPLVVGLVLAGPGLRSVRTQRPWAHVWRTVLGICGMCLNFLTYRLLPIAEATVLLFTVPIFATILSAVFLKERVGPHRWGAVVLGFVGVLIVVQPGGSALPAHGVLVGMTASLVVSAINITLRQIGKTETATTTVFWFTIMSMPLAVALPVFGHMHDSYTFGILLVLGILGGIAQLTSTAALRLAPVSVVLPIDYSSLIWAALVGWLIFQTVPSPTLWLGAPLIIGSGLYIVLREQKLHRQKTLSAAPID